MAEQNSQPKTLDELRKAVNSPNLQVAPTMILHYGKITLHVQAEGFHFDGSQFHQKLAVIREIKPERKARKPKEEKPQAAKATGKK